MTHPHHRDTIFLEEATLLTHEAHPGDQFIMRLQAPKCARSARPGQFVHLTVDPLLPLRRPISIMLASPEEGWIELLYKKVGQGTALLAQRKPGETLSLLGPIGKSFEAKEKRPLLIGGGVGMPPMIFLAESLRQDDRKPLVILGSEVPFPFKASPSQLLVDGIPEGIIATLPLLDQWGIACRLASSQEMPGVYQGYVTDLAREWLGELDRLRPPPHAGGGGETGRRVRSAGAGLAGGVHGLRRGRLRRLHRAGGDRKRPGHAAGLRGRAGVRRVPGVQLIPIIDDTHLQFM